MKCSKCGETNPKKFYWHHKTICKACLRRYARIRYRQQKQKEFEKHQRG